MQPPCTRSLHLTDHALLIQMAVLYIICPTLCMYSAYSIYFPVVHAPSITNTTEHIYVYLCMSTYNAVHPSCVAT